jgi:phage baseplate assembly protein W
MADRLVVTNVGSATGGSEVVVRRSARARRYRIYLFQPNIPSTHTLIEDRIRQALGRWEPRIELESVRVAASAEDPREAIATLRYRLVATGDAGRLDLTLRLTG